MRRVKWLLPLLIASAFAPMRSWSDSPSFGHPCPCTAQQSTSTSTSSVPVTAAPRPAMFVSEVGPQPALSSLPLGACAEPQPTLARELPVIVSSPAQSVTVSDEAEPTLAQPFLLRFVPDDRESEEIREKVVAAGPQVGALPLVPIPEPEVAVSPASLIPIPELDEIRAAAVAGKGGDNPCGKDANGNPIPPCEGGTPPCPKSCTDADGTVRRECNDANFPCQTSAMPCKVCKDGDGVAICQPCDHDSNGTSDACFHCTPNAAGRYTTCYAHDTDDDGKKDSCCPDFRIIMIPDDNFSGRSLARLGIGETGKFRVVSETLNLSGFGPNQVQWTWGQSSGISTEVSITDDLTFTAGIEEQQFVVSATINGCTTSYSGEIIRPQQKKFIEVPNSVAHTQGNASVKVKLGIYYLPQDVSFWKCSMREESSPETTTTLTGYFLELSKDPVYTGNFNHTAAPQLAPMFKNTEIYNYGNIPGIPSGFMQDYKNVLQAIDRAGYDLADEAFTGPIPQFSNGTVTWSIPERCSVGSHNAFNLPFNVIQVMTIDANGAACVSKDSFGPLCKGLNEATIPQ